MFGRGECRRVCRLLWDYTAGRLDTPERARVAEHLRRCHDCRRQEAVYAQTTRLMRTYRERPLPAPREDWPALRCRLERNQPGVSMRHGRFAALATGGGALVAGMLLPLLGGSDPYPDTDPPAPRTVAARSPDASSGSGGAEGALPPTPAPPRDARVIALAEAHASPPSAAGKRGSGGRTVRADRRQGARVRPQTRPDEYRRVADQAASAVAADPSPERYPAEAVPSVDGDRPTPEPMGGRLLVMESVVSAPPDRRYVIEALSPAATGGPSAVSDAGSEENEIWQAF